jgi:hypothetical protein
LFTTILAVLRTKLSLITVITMLQQAVFVTGIIVLSVIAGTFFKLDTSKCSLQSTSQEKLPSNDFRITQEKINVDCVTSAPSYEFENFGCSEICKEKTACAGGAFDGQRSTCRCTLCLSLPKTE